jgi:hypothetical protein
MPTITVTPNTNIVLVNTASGDQTTVNLPPVTPGQLITIRDNVGAASSSNQITITTTGGSVFSTGTVLPDGNSNIKISQPFGAVTVGYSGGYKWNILNTFAFENPAFAKVDAVTVSSITFRDSIGNGSNYLLNVNNNILYRNGIKIIEGPEFNSGIARHNGGVSSLSSIVSYGLSTVAAQPHYGLSSLSSIVSYGLSSLVGASGGDSTPSNWAAYPAISNLDMADSNIINVGSISMTGQLNFPKFITIVFGDSDENVSIGNNNVDNQSYLKLTGPTYIDGSLTLTDSDITGPNGTSLTYNGNPIGGGGGGGDADASTWATYPATATVNMGNYSISNASNVNASNVNASNVNVSGTLTVRSVTEFPSNTILYIPSYTGGTGRINFLDANNTGFASLQANEVIYDIFYNNSLWVAVGETSPLGYIYTSSNGTTWNKSASAILLGTAISRNIIYASNIWVLVGFTNVDQKIAYSTDGYNWSRNPNIINRGLHCIGYNGNNKWVIGGVTSDSSWTLATLDNITSGTFTPATGGFTDAAFRVLYANNIWVAVGRDTNNKEIHYSTNASQWYPASNTTAPGSAFFTVEGKALAYGNGYWLTGGDGNNIYGSLNGSNFSVFYTAASGITVDDIKYESGSTFYATFRTNSSNILAKSTNNGSNWSIITNIIQNLVTSRIGISYIPSYSVSSNTIIGGGTLNINSINLNGISMTTSPKSNILLYNSQPVNFIGGHIELRYSNGYVSYPLYVTSTPTQISVNMSNGGWWNSYDSNTTIFSGVSVFPNYIFGIGLDSITNYYSNVSNIPAYLSLVNPTVPVTRLYYTLTAI